MNKALKQTATKKKTAASQATPVLALFIYFRLLSLSASVPQSLGQK